ncbi:hypothetical protein [Bradyrhizobium erythrophlei]|jgi:hypothetical protein|uniref:hypothetical protein n=1 Tax=Bradyrhizobium erythrophlei TaxID=1437360 RepID=UPI0012EC5352|nr:hypothetical protein [Bradyrhizobium erythrophlei]
MKSAKAPNARGHESNRTELRIIGVVLLALQGKAPPRRMTRVSLAGHVSMSGILGIETRANNLNAP